MKPSASAPAATAAMASFTLVIPQILTLREFTANQTKIATRRSRCQENVRTGERDKTDADRSAKRVQSLTRITGRAASKTLDITVARHTFFDVCSFVLVPASSPANAQGRFSSRRRLRCSTWSARHGQLICPLFGA